ncbi:lipoate--protein ligase family protein [Paenibacillus kobensis]|uniref:lipoate--protein ligase family protein n=1 Tax=Paenibacillus kobensis TaxID=59841 RepID=UPI001FE53A60|nr:lipoate--protein ligase family protein [Paenibacillus kobensis]
METSSSEYTTIPPDEYAGMLILDRMNDHLRGANDPLHAFALDELLCRRTGEGGPPVCHIWRHSGAFILGQRDARLPHAAEALLALEAQHYKTAVRSSGGAAVPLDDGVVNVSLILPMASSGAGARFNRDFERMYELIAEALAPAGARVDKGEVEGAYCPGDYDLSIAGRKFCGIAQRRQAKAFIIQAFIVAEGSGSMRAAAIRAFYDQAAAGAEPSTAYPRVVPGSTASLEELTAIGPGAAAAFAERIKTVVRSRQQPDALAASAARLQLPQQDELQAMIESLRSRYLR